MNDPIAYGPTGIRCGCGKDAYSNLTPCQPEITSLSAAVAAEGALPVPVGDQPQPLDDTRLAEIAERASKRAAALTAWLNKFSPLSEGQREVENAETVLEEDVPTLLAEVQRLKAELAGRVADATEFGIRIPDGTVLLSGSTKDRSDQKARLERYLDTWPDAELVQRPVFHGEWAAAPTTARPEEA